jgi:GTPase SAR1 family protein
MDLPQIAVVGSQSAGKSSLIESISGITLPRAAGTCTRYLFVCTFVDPVRVADANVDAQLNVDSPMLMKSGNVLYLFDLSLTPTANLWVKSAMTHSAQQSTTRPK